MLRRAFDYLRPHIFAVPATMLVTWLVSRGASLGGGCRALCQPGVWALLGLGAGLLGAQLYRSEHPLSPRD